jgi:hypothetical protein
MIRYVLPAAVAALALGTVAGEPATVQAQTVAPAPQPMPNAPATTMTNANAAATISGQPQPGPYDENQGYVQPMPGPYMLPMSPRTTWIPGHYDWNPATSNYAWTEGQFVEAPRENAQWIPGHWAQTPTSWIWIDGGWR